MMIRMVLFVMWILFFGFPAKAQMETVTLEEIVVEGLPFEKFSTGSKLQKSDSLELNVLDQGTLADYMQKNTTVYIKEQGNKMLASVSFRGTGPAHTAVFWHGINLNSLTLGSTDFNSVPLFLFDDITIQYGGASSLHGSDAIGGSIHLGSAEHWMKGSKIQVRQDFGSFGNVFSGVKVDFGNGKWASKTKIFNRILKNNFTYTITDRIGDTYEIEQQNAEVHNYGLLQEVNGKIRENGILSMKAWLGNNYHQVQPIEISSPDQPQIGDEILDRNLRLVTEYEHFFTNGILLTSLGYVWDYQLFNDTDLIETKRASVSLSYEWNLSEKTTLKSGGNTQYIRPNVWSYQEDLSEWRGDVFVSINQILIKNWQMNLNARQTFVPFTTAPLAPSFSTSYAIKKPDLNLTFRGQVERSYRIPTFNDRYWGDQGRNDLNSENGYSMELGHNLVWDKQDYKLDFDVVAYYMIVDDWIAWKPAGTLWRPYNLKKVKANGVELKGKITWPISHGSFDLGGMYAYNRSILLQGVSENDPSVGYQLPYTPINRFGIYANVMYKKMFLGVNASYTGGRNGIDVINEEVPDFLLTDVTFSKNFSFRNQGFSIEGQVLNVFDVAYHNVNRYAMPGRNFLISLNFLIHK